MLTQEHIDNQFIENRSWQKYFLSKHPIYEPKYYIELAWNLFVKNGYSYELERFSNNPESKVYTAIKSIDLYHRAEFIVGYTMVNEFQALEQLLIMVICEHEVDFNKFK